MIELEDPIWAELTHCYGSGAGIPEQIRHIESTKNPAPKFWDELGNTLCHQCTVGTASIAAFPHLVRIASENGKTRKGFAALKLAAEILAFTIGPENKIPQMPKKLGEPFRKAISEGQQLVSSMLFIRKRNFPDTMEILAIAGVFSFQADCFLLLGTIRDRWFDCPACEERVETDRLYTW
ncbi:hypothetical protein LOC67_26920 [Stieleria sp. JC731]|uniref:hypothetical protein n=1 Tax=Stieleria sp. JC731 TaxID=2894195 RepID=UPI001E346F57|nr:hypothetical protein [Stieleria sp. JC731]MCC9604203.1 hypothetical protein [Stieleria sp. JC731]